MVTAGGNFFAYKGFSVNPVIRLAGGSAPYDIWTATQFTAAQIASGISDRDADPDNDNLSNEAEMALGTNPNLANDEPAFGLGGNGGLEVIESDGTALSWN